MSFEKISVVGLGYIGLPTAAMFAAKKQRVIGVDTNSEAVATINRGEIHIVEPGLATTVKNAVEGGYLRASERPEAADAFLIAVPTPFKAGVDGNPQPNLEFVAQAVKSVAPVLKKGDLVVLESTSPVGTTELLASWLADQRPDLTFPHLSGDEADISIAYCPERVLPGNVVRELVENDRIIGGLSVQCSDRASELYRLFVKGDCLVTDARTAELAKLTENASRDVQIAFANELSMICDRLSINVWELIGLANRHPRVDILQPGPGVGGHCIAVDPWFIVSSAPEESQIISTARAVNHNKTSWVIEKINKAIDEYGDMDPGLGMESLAIAFYGISFKADIDDLRESPARAIVESILRMKTGRVMIVEPNIKTLPESLAGAELIELELAKWEADIHVLLVDHEQFKVSQPPRTGVLIDTKGIWRKD